MALAPPGTAPAPAAAGGFCPAPRGGAGQASPLAAAPAGSAPSLRRRAEFGPGLRRSDFDVVRYLGQGSLGAVVEARHRASGSAVALKAVGKQRVLAQDLGAQLLDEVKAQRELVHPNLLPCLAHFEEGGSLFLVLELAAGGSLQHRLRRGRLDEHEAARAFVQVLLGLRFLHSRGKLHLNLKPANVLLDGGGLGVKICDFGGSAEFAGRRTFCGTPGALAPEVVAGEGCGPASDAWAAGALLLELLCGAPPPAEAAAGAAAELALWRPVDEGQLAALPRAARPLLRGLLRREVAERMSVEDALRHPWLAQQRCPWRVAAPPPPTTGQPGQACEDEDDDEVVDPSDEAEAVAALEEARAVLSWMQAQFEELSDLCAEPLPEEPRGALLWNAEAARSELASAQEQLQRLRLEAAPADAASASPPAARMPSTAPLRSAAPRQQAGGPAPPASAACILGVPQELALAELDRARESRRQLEAEAGPAAAAASCRPAGGAGPRADVLRRAQELIARTHETLGALEPGELPPAPSQDNVRPSLPATSHALVALARAGLVGAEERLRRLELQAEGVSASAASGARAYMPGTAPLGTPGGGAAAAASRVPRSSPLLAASRGAQGCLMSLVGPAEVPPEQGADACPQPAAARLATAGRLAPPGEPAEEAAPAAPNSRPASGGGPRRPAATSPCLARPPPGTLRVLPTDPPPRGGAAAAAPGPPPTAPPATAGADDDGGGGGADAAADGGRRPPPTAVPIGTSGGAAQPPTSPGLLDATSEDGEPISLEQVGEWYGEPPTSPGPLDVTFKAPPSMPPSTQLLRERLEHEAAMPAGSMPSARLSFPGGASGARLPQLPPDSASAVPSSTSAWTFGPDIAAEAPAGAGSTAHSLPPRSLPRTDVTPPHSLPAAVSPLAAALAAEAAAAPWPRSPPHLAASPPRTATFPRDTDEAGFPTPDSAERAAAAAASPSAAPPPPSHGGGLAGAAADAEWLSAHLGEQLRLLGFPDHQVVEATRRCSTIEAAVEWIYANPSSPLEEQLLALGFSYAQAAAAARRCSSAEAAVQWLAEHPDGPYDALT